VCVKMYPSSRIYVVFVVGEAETQQEEALREPERAVGLDVGLTRLATLSDRWPLP
jgi:transposase